MNPQYRPRTESQQIEHDEAMEAWRESESILATLRTLNAQPIQRPTEEEMLKWYRELSR